jgi:hypothetical protein
MDFLATFLRWWETRTARIALALIVGSLVLVWCAWFLWTLGRWEGGGFRLGLEGSSRSLAAKKTPSEGGGGRVQPPAHLVSPVLKRASQCRESLSPAQLFSLAEVHLRGLYGTPVDLVEAAELYQESARRAQKGGAWGGEEAAAELVGACHLALGKLHRDGGGDGRHKPRADAAVREFLLALGSGCEYALVEIADVYAFGLHPSYLPEKLTAGQIFNFAAKEHRLSDRLRALCATRMAEIQRLAYTDLDDVQQPGQKYDPLPTGVVAKLAKAVQSCPRMRPCGGLVLPTQQVRSQLRQMVGKDARSRGRDVAEDVLLQNALWADVLVQNMRGGGAWARYVDADAAAATDDGRRAHQLLDVVPRQNVDSDSQNVHGSTVQHAVKKRLDRLESKVPLLSDSPTEGFQERRERFLAALERANDGSDDGRKPLSDEQVAAVKRVLESLGDACHSRYDRSEAQVFETVMARIEDPVNAERREDMLVVLGQNMASAVEHDAVVCSTGKIVRMVGALDGMDAEQMPLIKPEWAVHEEIAQSAAKVREEVLAGASPSEKAAYEAVSPDAAQQVEADRLAEEMKHKLAKKCRAEYADVLSSDALDAKLEEYVSAF